MNRPLPDEVARPARAYLAALVPGDEVSDAWHELLADVAYWDERQLLPVLRLAHQVVLQHQRVTPEVAALALVERGIEAPADVAVVLDTDAATARRWTEQAIASRDGDEGATPVTAGRFSDRARPAAPAPASGDAPPRASAAPVAAPTADAPAAAAVDDTPPADGPAPDGPAPDAVRIGFEEDEPLPDLDARRGVFASMRGVAATVLVVLVVAVVVWLLAR